MLHIAKEKRRRERHRRLAAERARRESERQFVQRRTGVAASIADMERLSGMQGLSGTDLRAAVRHDARLHANVEEHADASVWSSSRGVTPASAVTQAGHSSPGRSRMVGRQLPTGSSFTGVPPRVRERGGQSDTKEELGEGGEMDDTGRPGGVFDGLGASSRTRRWRMLKRLHSKRMLVAATQQEALMAFKQEESNALQRERRAKQLQESNDLDRQTESMSAMEMEEEDFEGFDHFSGEQHPEQETVTEIDPDDLDKVQAMYDTSEFALSVEEISNKLYAFCTPGCTDFVCCRGCHGTVREGGRERSGIVRGASVVEEDAGGYEGGREGSGGDSMLLLPPSLFDSKAPPMHPGSVRTGQEYEEADAIEDGLWRMKWRLMWAKRWLIAPFAPARRIWLLYIVAAILYSCVMVPFRLGFDVVLSPEQFVLELLFVDGFFIADIFFSLFTRHRTANRLSRSKRHPFVANAYVYFWTYFFIDFLSSVPFDAILLATLGQGENFRGLKLVRVVRLARLLRLLKLARVFRLRPMLSSLSQRVATAFHATARLVRTFILVTAVAHLLACIWHYLTLRPSGDDQVDDSGSIIVWIDNVDIPIDKTMSNLRGRYILSFYWTIATMMAVGYGDVHAVTDSERIFSLFCMLIGAVFFGIIVANVSELINSINARAFALAQRLDEVREYMIDRNLPPDLQHRITSYYRYYYTQKSLFNEAEVLSGLAKPLKTELVRFTMRSVIRGIIVFRDMDPSILATLVTRMKPNLHMPCEIIAEEASVGKEMFFLLRGAVDIIATIPQTLLNSEGSVSTPGLVDVDQVRRSGVGYGSSVPPPRPFSERFSFRFKRPEDHHSSSSSHLSVAGETNDGRVGDRGRDEGERKLNEGGMPSPLPLPTPSPSPSPSPSPLHPPSPISVQVPSPSVLLGIYTDGHHFGDMSLLLGIRRPVGFRAASVCNLQVLSKEDLDTVLFDFPQLHERLRQQALDRYERLTTLRESVLRHARRHGMRRTSETQDEVSMEKVQRAYQDAVKDAKGSSTRTKSASSKVHPSSSSSSSAPYPHPRPTAATTATPPPSSPSADISAKKSSTPSPTPPSSLHLHGSYEQHSIGDSRGGSMGTHSREEGSEAERGRGEERHSRGSRGDGVGSEESESRKKAVVFVAGKAKDKAHKGEIELTPTVRGKRGDPPKAKKWATEQLVHEELDGTVSATTTSSFLGGVLQGSSEHRKSASKSFRARSIVVSDAGGFLMLNDHIVRETDIPTGLVQAETLGEETETVVRAIRHQDYRICCCATRSEEETSPRQETSTKSTSSTSPSTLGRAEDKGGSSRKGEDRARGSRERSGEEGAAVEEKGGEGEGEGLGGEEVVEVEDEEDEEEDVVVVSSVEEHLGESSEGKDPGQGDGGDAVSMTERHSPLGLPEKRGKEHEKDMGHGERKSPPLVPAYHSPHSKYKLKKGEFGPSKRLLQRSWAESGSKDEEEIHKTASFQELFQKQDQNGRSPLEDGVLLDPSAVEVAETEGNMRRRCICHPDDAWLARWRLGIMVLIVFSCIEVPIVVGFGLPDTGIIFALELLVDAAFVLDMVISFRTAFVLSNQSNVAVTLPWAIAVHYLRSDFALDFISTVPVDLIVTIVSGGGQELRGLKLVRAVRIVRVLRLLKLVRFVRLRRIVQRFRTGILSRITIPPAVFSLLKLFAEISAIAHLLACLFFYTSILFPGRHIAGIDLTLSKAKNDGLSMRSAAEQASLASGEDPLVLENAAEAHLNALEASRFGVAARALEYHWWTVALNSDTFSKQYAVSLYWSLTTMTSVGYGDVTAQTEAELIVGTLAMLIGASVFGYVVGSVATLVSRIRASSARESERMAEITDYLHDQRVPPGLYERVVRYYQYFLHRKSAFDEDVILHELSDTLKREVILHLNMDIIQRIPYFLHHDREFVTHIISLLQPQFVYPSTFLFREGEVAWEMFFLVKGQVEILVNAETVREKQLALLEAGSYFGELSLLLGTNRSSAARAVTHANLFTLTKDDIRSTVAFYPQLAIRMEETLRCTLKRAATVSSNLQHHASGATSFKQSSSNTSGTRGGVGGMHESDASAPPLHTTNPSSPFPQSHPGSDKGITSDRVAKEFFGTVVSPHSKSTTQVQDFPDTLLDRSISGGFLDPVRIPAPSIGEIRRRTSGEDDDALDDSVASESGGGGDRDGGDDGDGEDDRSDVIVVGEGGDEEEEEEEEEAELPTTSPSPQPSSPHPKPQSTPSSPLRMHPEEEQSPDH